LKFNSAVGNILFLVNNPRFLCFGFKDLLQYSSSIVGFNYVCEKGSLRKFKYRLGIVNSDSAVSLTTLSLDSEVSMTALAHVCMSLDNKR
jgi:hypothetical protein